MLTTDRPQPVSFVPTAFFAEFLAGAHEGFDSQFYYDVLHRISADEAGHMTTAARGSEATVS
jgi:hypothetical protein